MAVASSVQIFGEYLKLRETIHRGTLEKNSLCGNHYFVHDNALSTKFIITQKFVEK